MTAVKVEPKDDLPDPAERAVGSLHGTADNKTYIVVELADGTKKWKPVDVRKL